LLVTFSPARLRRPPTPTLFPYTTLFRSGRAQGDGRPARGDREPYVGVRDPRRIDSPRELLVRGGDEGVPSREPRARPAPHALGGDRKSTRLNSSHVAISYAVFCLKKKKT